MDKTPTNIVHGHATEVQGDALETKCTRFECLLMTTKEKEKHPRICCFVETPVVTIAW